MRRAGNRKGVCNMKILLTLIICAAVLQMTTQAPTSDTELLFNYIDKNQDMFVQTLKEWVAIESDSSSSALFGKVMQMVNVTAEKIRSLGGDVELADIGSQQMPDGEIVQLPPVILAELPKDSNKPTLCIYGHVDVQPAKKEDGWLTEPYVLTEINGNLYGRGATDNKGPVLAWLHAVEAYQALKQDLPVNIKFIIEGLEEIGSYGLDALTKQRNDTFFADVDYIVISDNIWISNKPGLTYGTRGDCYFYVKVSGGKQALHSGAHGGSLFEPMADLIALLDSLVDAKGQILVPGIYDDVAPLTEEERKLYENIQFDLEEYKNNIGVTRLIYDKKEDVLMHYWRYPSLSIHGIQGAYADPGSKTVIPNKVIGKFSMRQVPNMDPVVVEKQVTEYLHEIFAKRNSSNTLKILMPIAAKPWVANVNDPQYVAARRAIKTVFGVEPDMIREGSTIPIAWNFQDVTKKSVMMLPICGADDGEHSEKEKISRSNYIEGTKLFAAFFYELAQLR
ncbi:beta-Ala-His dipeptidase-like isoform X1 [Erpetoichthys calabaricus]|uniref:Carnosine dipeptidase 1 n=2 Tax=Erpetoichthys calabaricus TaxID=27687 RepID=A0A8C4TCB5_ERPCA|nr:beta-Ala-His dipeptidase-like isoform X1 [Erpetoichthys calabaricus]